MRHHAGSDLRDNLALAPHGDEKVTAMPTVGTLSGKGEFTGMTMPRKTFYEMAYLNLAVVFSIIFILAIWRWW